MDSDQSGMPFFSVTILYIATGVVNTELVFDYWHFTSCNIYIQLDDSVEKYFNP